MTKKFRFYTDKLGQRQYTLASLREKIEDAYHEETAGRLDILSELDTREKQTAAIREVADYVLSTEYVNLPPEDKNEMIAEAVANLFYFGAVDKYLQDADITEITLEGIQESYARYGFADLQAIEAPFEDMYKLETSLTRLIAPAGAVLMESTPFIEVGMKIHQRPVRVSLICPPIQPMYSVQVRLHPSKPLQLSDLVPSYLPEVAVELLQKIIESKRGLLVTGEVGVGKTTVIAALLNHFKLPENTVVVERAQEMVLPDSVKRLAAIPAPYKRQLEIPARLDEGVKTFEAQIGEAVDHMLPQLLVMDELRGDEGAAIWKTLTSPDLPQVIAALRGTANPARLYSALKIAINKADPTIEAEPLNQALLQKMPFVMALQRPKRSQPPRMVLLGQWIADGEMLTVQPLVTWGLSGEVVRTEHELKL